MMTASHSSCYALAPIPGRAMIRNTVRSSATKGNWPATLANLNEHGVH